MALSLLQQSMCWSSLCSYMSAYMLQQIPVCCRRIEQSSLDGSFRQVVVERINYAISLAVFAHHVYWSGEYGSMLLSFSYFTCGVNFCHLIKKSSLL